MPVIRNTPDASKFNAVASLPYELRLEDFRLAIQDVYDFFHDVNTGLVAKGRYAGNAIKSGEHGVEIKTTRKPGGAVDTHGARDQWMCVFVYAVDNTSEPANERRPLSFTEVYLGQVQIDDFRKNARGELGTRTATLHAQGIAKLRSNWVYRA